MRIGTRSVLYGAHCFFIHPWFVAEAWRRLYGFPFDPRLWVAFFVHDIGYLGKPNMDGPEGETHVELGARIMSIFGPAWSDFSRYHSRFYAKRDDAKPSRLCFADKLATALTPAWLYLRLVNLTGEIEEYMERSGNGKYKGMVLDLSSQRAWFDEMNAYMRRWVTEHVDGRDDTWTPRRAS